MPLVSLNFRIFLGRLCACPTVGVALNNALDGVQSMITFPFEVVEAVNPAAALADLSLGPKIGQDVSSSAPNKRYRFVRLENVEPQDLDVLTRDQLNLMVFAQQQQWTTRYDRAERSYLERNPISRLEDIVNGRMCM